ncbi:NADPH-dependent F420 reductase, partial [Saccharomonospora halophila]|uniref:NADPH-dependent F420 reductase n=1 Tax=Saccharomonospora halophila TaxID=129922 RepID=UPI000584DA36
ADAAAAADFAVLAMPLTGADRLPVAELADKVVLDTNNYMVWRDGHIPAIDSGARTEHELRQEQLPTSRIAKAFTHIQAPTLLSAGRPAGDPDRLALSVSSDFPDAVALVTRLYDRFGFDTVDNSPLRESWRTTPGQPAWHRHAQQNRAELARNLRDARFVPHARP